MLFTNTNNSNLFSLNIVNDIIIAFLNKSETLVCCSTAIFNIAIEFLNKPVFSDAEEILFEKLLDEICK